LKVTNFSQIRLKPASLAALAIGKMSMIGRSDTDKVHAMIFREGQLIFDHLAERANLLDFSHPDN